MLEEKVHHLPADIRHMDRVEEDLVLEDSGTE
jgi:hypothetical protein